MSVFCGCMFLQLVHFLSNFQSIDIEKKTMFKFWIFWKFTKITLYKNLIYRKYLNVYITRLLYGPWQAWTPYLCTLPTPRTRTTSLWGGRWRRTTRNSWPYTCGALPSSVCSHTWCIAKRFTSLYRTNVHVNMKLPVYTSSVLQIHLLVHMKGFSSPCNNTLIHYTFALKICLDDVFLTKIEFYSLRFNTCIYVDF